ncbi:hypothetical protein D3C80_1559800 [compost metagenome]
MTGPVEAATIFAPSRRSGVSLPAASSVDLAIAEAGRPRLSPRIMMASLSFSRQLTTWAAAFGPFECLEIEKTIDGFL